MALRRLRRTWDKLTEQDAMWAALADPQKLGGRWVSDEFLQHGRDELEEHFSRLDELGIAVPRGRALDFGCGPGRLAIALLPHFTEVHAVDISPEMLARAREFSPPDAAITFHSNQTSSLEQFPSDYFSFVLSVLVLQHMPPRYAKRYLAEFVRVLEPGGIALVQIPSHPLPSEKQHVRHNASPALRNAWRRLRARGAPVMGAYSVRRETVVRILEQSGAEVCSAAEDTRAGLHWVSYTYVARKRG